MIKYYFLLMVWDQIFPKKTKEEEGLRREDLESKADSDGEVLVEEEKAMEPEDSAPNGKRKTEWAVEGLCRE